MKELNNFLETFNNSPRLQSQWAIRKFFHLAAEAALRWGSLLCKMVSNLLVQTGKPKPDELWNRLLHLPGGGDMGKKG